MAEQLKNLDNIETTKEQEQLKAQNDILLSIKEVSHKVPAKTKIINDVAPKILKALRDEGLDMKNIRDKTRVLDGKDSKF